MVISVFKKFVAAVTTSVVCAGLIGCGDGVGQARDEALSQLDGMVWLEYNKVQGGEGNQQGADH